MKKLFCVLLAVTLLTTFGLSSFAFAADEITSVSPFRLVRGYVASNDVNLRAGPGYAWDVHCTVQMYDTFTIIGDIVYQDARDWVPVRMTSGGAEGRTGWIAKDYVTIVE